MTLCNSCPRQTASDFTKALQEIRYAGLSYDFVDKTTQVEDSVSDSQAASLRTPATNKICSAVGLIERVMKDLDYRLHDGEVYRKVPQAKFTFVRSSSVNDFVHALLSNPKMAEVIAPQISSVISILSNSGCQIIRQIEFDYNLIEVKPQGCCFNIELKKFVYNPLLESSVGKVSPRAYVSYTYQESKKPDPKPFIESVCNSFPDEGERRRFLRKYYQILLHGKFPQKTTKLCVVGPSDSGKTSWFSPFQGVLPVSGIASVTREKHFSAHLIKPSTQVVFIDEWTSDSLCAEDAKKVLQGGLQILPQKNKEASKCVYKSGFYITTNEMPRFGGVDDEAIRRRLAVFQTDPLPTVKRSTTKWLRKNCMQVFHYCADELKDQDLFSDNDEDEDMELDGNNSDEGALYNDFDRDDSIQLMSVDEIATYEFSQDKLKSTVDKAEESTRLSVVPKKVLDELFLNMDDLEPKRWWNPHGMFQGYGDPNSAEYHEHTMLIAAGRWKQMLFSQRDLMRFKLRYENKWSGSDTFCDAWLINEGLRRTEFDYNLFIERYPAWKAWCETHKTERFVPGKYAEKFAKRFGDPDCSQCSCVGGNDVMNNASQNGSEEQRQETLSQPANDAVNKSSPEKCAMHPEVDLSSGEVSGKPSLLEYKTETAPSQQTAPSDYQANELLLHSQVYNNSEVTLCEGTELAESLCKKFTESVMSPTSEDCKVANDTIVFETPEKGQIPGNVLPGACEVSKARSQPATLEHLAEFKPGIKITKRVRVIYIDDN